MLSKETIQGQHSVSAILTFIAMMVTNTAVILVANALFPNQVVLGSLSVPFWWAVYHSMLELSVITLLVLFGVTICEWKTKTIFTPAQWMGLYFVVNVVALWGITRFAEQMGLGVSAWWVLLILAGVFDFLQGMVMMFLGKTVIEKLAN
jgi:hypothetical protein